MRRLVLACVLVSAVGRGAAAGRVAQWPSDGSPVEIAPASVHARLSGAVATLTARFSIPVEAGYRPTSVSLELPQHALVTSATVTTGGVLHRLDLVPVKTAEARFTEVANQAGTGTRPSAVVIDGAAGHVTLGIASPRAGAMVVALELSAPTCYFRDTRYVDLPPSWTNLEAALRPRITRAPAVFDACGVAADDEARLLGFAAPAPATHPSGERVAATAGRLALGADHIVRVELDLAAALSDIPRDLATVILVDTSRSMSAKELDAERDLALAYLRGAPASRVQVIAFDRTAHPLLPGWSIASQALPRLRRELDAVAARNGSNVDAGLAEAAAWLRRVEGTRRVVVLTDEQFAERLTSQAPEALRALLPAATLVHVVATQDAASALVRDDETWLAPLAKLTEGLATRLGFVDGKPVDATMLLRPIELTDVVVSAPGWKPIKPNELAIPCGADAAAGTSGTLDEGAACTWWGEGTATSGPISIRGLAWNKPVTRVLRPDPAQARGVARELSALHTLDEDAQARVDVEARAVNDAWSLFGRWGGHGGYDELFGMTGGTGVCGCDTVGTVGTSTSTGTADWVVANKLDLRGQLEAAVAACQLGRDRADVQLEMTMLEIVDVHVTVTGRVRTAPDELRALASCLTEALWDATPMLPHPQSHATYKIALGGAS